MKRKKLAGLIALAILLVGATVALAAGGSISGIVKDPGGAVVPGATVTVTSTTGAQAPRTVTTDQEGRYKIEGLAPGSYAITVSGKGFSESKRENITVDDGKSASVDFELELSTVEAAVDVTTAGLKGNSDPVYQKLRMLSKDPGAFSGTYATVNNLVLKRDSATFTLRSGEIYFLAAVEDRVTGAVFIGDGELSLVPPTETEKRAIAIFTEAPELKEQVTELVFRFTDNTFDEIKGSPNATVGNTGPQASKA